MSIKPSLKAFGAAAVMAILFAVLPLVLISKDAFDLEVRTAPWRTHAGQVTKASPIGQGFQANWNGLDRIDVALVTLGPTKGAELELVLRRGGRESAVLRRARLDPAQLEQGRGWVSFQFDPVPDSAGESFWFELKVTGGRGRSPYSPWIRYHGHPGEDTPWGTRVLTGELLESELADHSPSGVAHFSHGHLIAPNLAAVAFATESINPARGEVSFELWRSEDDPESTPPLRSVQLHPDEKIHGGWTFFAFEPVEDSRHERFKFRLHLNETARLVGFENGPSVKTFHGGTPSQPPLLGMTRGKQVMVDRSLIFRVHGAPTPSQLLDRIHQRAGWKLAAAALSWLLAVSLLVRLCTYR